MSKNTEDVVIVEEESTPEVIQSAPNAPIISRDEKLKDTAQNAIDKYAMDGIGAVQKKFSAGELSGSEAGKDVAHVIITAEAMSDTKDNEKFLKEFKSTKQDELIESAKKELYKEQASKIAAKQVKAEAFYTSYRPILEFDLDHLLVKNAPKRPKYKKVLNKETGRKEKVLIDDGEVIEVIEEKPKHTYAERSYGIPLMVMMLLVLTIPYFICTVILSIFSAINYLFVAISRFSKPAFYICAGMASIVILGLFVYAAILCVEGAFNVQIIPALIK